MTELCGEKMLICFTVCSTSFLLERRYVVITQPTATTYSRLFSCQCDTMVFLISRSLIESFTRSTKRGGFSSITLPVFLFELEKEMRGTRHRPYSLTCVNYPYSLSSSSFSHYYERNYLKHAFPLWFRNSTQYGYKAFVLSHHRTCKLCEHLVDQQDRNKPQPY